MVLCGACAIGVMGQLALASPTHRGRATTHRVRRCSAQAHNRGGRSRRHAKRCPAVHRRTVHHSAIPTASPGSPTSPSAGGSGTSTPGSPFSPPLPAATGLPSDPGEVRTPPPPSVPHVQVTAVEFSFTLSRTSVPAGKVIFEFVNNGQDEHNLNLLPTEGAVAGTFPNAPSKGVEDQQINMKAGTYSLFCSLPEHESKGMKATLVVE